MSRALQFRLERADLQRPPAPEDRSRKTGGAKALKKKVWMQLVCVPTPADAAAVDGTLEREMRKMGANPAGLLQPEPARLNKPPASLDR